MTKQSGKLETVPVTSDYKLVDILVFTQGLSKAVHDEWSDAFV